MNRLLICLLAASTLALAQPTPSSADTSVDTSVDILMSQATVPESQSPASQSTESQSPASQSPASQSPASQSTESDATVPPPAEITPDSSSNTSEASDPEAGDNVNANDAEDGITDEVSDEAVEDVPAEPDALSETSGWPAIFSAEARELLRRAETTAVQAYFMYDRHTPDRPLWREALRLGRAARESAPERVEPIRFLAEIYLITEWYARAWQSWQDYIALGGELDSSALAQLSIAGKNIGFLSYQQENLERAEQFYAQVFALNPEDDEALLWLGRLNFERQDPEAALPFWQEAVRRELREPQAQVARYFLQRTQSQIVYGIAASNAFYQGFEAYQVDDLEAALNGFVRAINLNDQYVDAVRLAGRVNLERGNLEQALRFYRRASDLAADLAAEANIIDANIIDADGVDVDADGVDTTDAPTADYFRTADVDPEQYGEVAVQAFREGVQAFEALDFVMARRFLARATALNANYVPAWLWRAYTEFELGNAAAAVNAFQRVVQLEPDNTTFATTQAQARAQAAAQAAATLPANTGTTPTTPSTVPSAVPTSPQPTSPQGVPLGDPQLINVPTLPTGENLVLLDITYTHNGNFDLETNVATGTRAFTFFDVPTRIPNNLAFPVNYAGGTLYQRLEVRNKPSGFPVQYQHCLLQSALAFSGDALSSVSACSDANGLTLTAPGIYEHVQPLPSLVRVGAFNWRQPVAQQLLIVKDRRGVPIDNRYGFAGNWYASPIFSLYYPMQVRYTAVIVPPGGEFTGWP